VTCPHNPVTAPVGIFQSNVFLSHREHILSGFSPTEEFVLYRKQCFLCSTNSRTVFSAYSRMYTSLGFPEEMGSYHKEKQGVFPYCKKSACWVTWAWIATTQKPPSTYTGSQLSSWYCTENRSSRSILGWALAQISPEQMLEFHFLGTHLLDFQNKETSIFAMFTLQDEHIIYHFLYNAQPGGRGWDGQTVDTWLSCTHIYEMTRMYVYAYTRVCVCVCVYIYIHIFTWHYLQNYVYVHTYTYTIFKTIWDKNYSSLNNSSITTILIQHSCE
jgi:hypothetical protein